MDVRPILAELRLAFPRQFKVLKMPDEFGSDFRGTLRLADGDTIIIEVLSNYEDIPDSDLVPSKKVSGMRRVSLERYLTDKVQCIAERTEARDLVDIAAVLHRHPRLENHARRLLRSHDPLMLAERLLSWKDADLRKDLKAYKDVKPADAIKTRDLLLKWLGTPHKELKK